MPLDPSVERETPAITENGEPDQGRTALTRAFVELIGFEPTDSRSEYATRSLRKMRSKGSTRGDAASWRSVGRLWAETGETC